MPRVETAAQKKDRELRALLEYGMTLAGFSKTRVAELMRIHPSTLSRKLHHPDGFTLAELRRLSVLLHWSADEKGKVI